MRIISVVLILDTWEIYTDTYIADGIRAELNLTAFPVYLKHDWQKCDCSIVSMRPLNSTDSIWVGTDLNNVYCLHLRITSYHWGTIGFEWTSKKAKP